MDEGLREREGKREGERLSQEGTISHVFSSPIFLISGAKLTIHTCDRISEFLFFSFCFFNVTFLSSFLLFVCLFVFCSPKLHLSKNLVKTAIV